MVIVIIFYLRYVHAICNVVVVVVVASAVELVVAPVVVGCSWRLSIIYGFCLSVITNVDF